MTQPTAAPSRAFDVEVVVAGAGPAGARAAELLARAGADVVMLDPRAPWEKPCGGGLTAAAYRHIPELRELGERARRVDVLEVESESGRQVRIRLAPPLHIVARRDLAVWQLDRAERAGARLEADTVTQIRPLAGGWHITLESGRELSARRVVGADGAASRARACLAPDVSVILEPTRTAFPGGAGGNPETAALRLFGGVAGYAWSFARVDHRSVGVGVAARSWRRPRMDQAVDGYLEPGDDVAALQRVGAAIGMAPPRPRWDALAGTDYALLGDAAGLADPLLGEGLTNALRSAGFLADAYAADGSFARYPRLTRAGLAREFRIAYGLRRILYTRDLGVRLVELAARRGAARAVLSALANATHAHGMGSLRIWGRARATR